MQLPPPVLRDRPPPSPGCPRAGGRHRAAQFSDINQIHGCGMSPKDISCCAPKSCAEEVQQWLAHTRPVRCGGRAHAARAARAGHQLLLAWPLSPLTSAFSCCSARACHFCLFFLQPSSRGKQSSDTRVRAYRKKEQTLGGSREVARPQAHAEGPPPTSVRAWAGGPHAVIAGERPLKLRGPEQTHTFQTGVPVPAGRPCAVTSLSPALLVLRVHLCSGCPGGLPQNGFIQWTYIDFHPGF